GRTTRLHSSPTRRSSDLALSEWLEALAGEPDAGLGGIEVGEDAEDAPAVGGTAGESVHVQQVVPLVQGQLASGLFQGAEAGEVQDRKSTRLNSSHDQISY